MRKYKYMIAQFTFYDRSGICSLLEAQAEKGWLLDRVTNYAWRFRRVEPQRIHYAVTYFPKASAFDPEPSEQQRELFAFCAHSGWILAGTTAQMQIFYNMAQEPVPIETDPVLELENIHRSAKKNYLPAYFLLLALAVFQLVLQLSQLLTFPLTYLSQDTAFFNWLCQSVLLLMCSLELFGYFFWYRRAKAGAENGEFVQTRGFRKLELWLLGIVMAALVWLLCSMRPQMAVSMAIILGMLFGMYAIVLGSQSLMKRRGVASRTNRTVTWVLTGVLSVVICGMMIPVLGYIMRLPVWAENREVRQWEWNGHYYDIYRDEIPLRVEDLADVHSEDYSYEAREKGSFLLKEGEYRQNIWASSKYPEMAYTIYSTEIPMIYDLVIREVTTPMDVPSGAYDNGELYYDTYIPQDAAPWGANVVYRRYAGGEADNHFVLCYGSSVVVFRPNWELTPEQMAVVGEKLGDRP